jgi:hypothetical protein
MTCVANTAPTESAPVLPALSSGPENGIKSHLVGGGEGEEFLAGNGETDTCLMISNHVAGSGETDTCLISNHVTGSGETDTCMISKHVAGKWDRKDVVEGGGASSQAPVHHL